MNKPRTPVTATELAEKVSQGNLRATARLMRLVDDQTQVGLDALEELYTATQPAKLLGVTGSPGAGKSTLIDQLIRHYRSLEEKVGVVAIDPTSPYSGGAILGDRVRMQDHVLDKGVFVRSLATRGQLGGLSLSATSSVAVLEGAGFSRILIETVGIGQSEVDIAQVADTTLVVLAPGFGDDVQALKAGLMEVADVFVVNKSDRPGADQVVRHVRQILDLRGPDAQGWLAPVVSVSAQNGTGIDDLAAAVDQHRTHLVGHDQLVVRRKARAMLEIETSLLVRLRQEMMKRAGAAGLDNAATQVASRKAHARAVSEQLLSPPRLID